MNNILSRNSSTFWVVVVCGGGGDGDGGDDGDTGDISFSTGCGDGDGVGAVTTGVGEIAAISILETAEAAT
jgi:hypothetical protein